jgi:hypothetical protein
MDPKVHIDGSDLKEIVIREGNAALVNGAPNVILIGGILKAPAQYLKEKVSGTDVIAMGVDVPLNLTESMKIYNPKRSHVLVDRHNGSLTLVLNEKDSYADKIQGTLSMFKDLEELGINKEKRYTINELIKVVKRNKYYFAELQEHGDFLISLTNFNTKVSTEIKHVKENNGSKLDSVQKIVNENKSAPTFKLSIPIYKGYPKVVFEVQVVVDVTDVNVTFTLESVDLFDLVKNRKDEYIDEQLLEIGKIFPCSFVEVQ